MESYSKYMKKIITFFTKALALRGLLCYHILWLQAACTQNKRVQAEDMR